MIQIIAFNKETDYKDNDIVLSTIAEPKSLDEFDINIIDLRDEKIWKNDSLFNNSLNNINDFHNLKSMIKRRKSSKIIVITPSNCRFDYLDMVGGRTRLKSMDLKNMLLELKEFIFKDLLGLTLSISLLYENTTTIIEGDEVSASFYFNVAEDVLTISNMSEKATTIMINGTYVTSLNISKSPESVKDFVKSIGLIETKQEVQDWFDEIEKFNDKKLKEEITRIEKETKVLDAKIHSAKDKLNENNNHKSILYTNSDELIAETFKILEDILECDLTEFVDLKKEDFEIKKDKITFIGEIKGINTNVKNSNISQLVHHVQIYKDNLSDEEKGTKVKGLLIINALRARNPEERDVVGQEQINFAILNESLIITTIELLNLYEKYKKNEVNSDQINLIFAEEKGLFSNK